jgi:hypothetical protein
MPAGQARFETLGAQVLELMPGEARRTLLYAEFDVGFVSASLFHEMDGALYYVDTTPALTDELFRLQALFEPDVKAFEFEIRDRAFDARFTYPDGFDSELTKPSRTRIVLKKVFGTDSVVYPQS